MRVCTRNVGIARPAAREPVPGKGTQTIDQGNDPAEDEKVAASHVHTTVTGVPTGTCSWSWITCSFNIRMQPFDTDWPIDHGSVVPWMR